MVRRFKNGGDGEAGIAQSESKTWRREGGFSGRGGDSDRSRCQRDGRDTQNASGGFKTRNSKREWFSDALAVACERLGIDDRPLGESVLHRVDAGASEPEAVRMTLVEYLQRRGLYHGDLRRLVDSGLVFQMRADE